MKWILGLAWMLAAVTAWGQSVYKCRDDKGGLVYQSDPCINAEKRWDVQPGARYGSHAPDDRMTSFQSQARVARDRQALAAANRRRGAVTTGTEVRIGGPTCAPMKQERDRARAAANTRWTYDMASWWDARVRAACK